MKLRILKVTGETQRYNVKNRFKYEKTGRKVKGANVWAKKPKAEKVKPVEEVKAEEAPKQKKYKVELMVHATYPSDRGFGHSQFVDYKVTAVIEADSPEDAKDRIIKEDLLNILLNSNDAGFNAAISDSKSRITVGSESVEETEDYVSPPKAEVVAFWTGSEAFRRWRGLR